MRNSAAVSINEISRATALSKMTVHKIIDYYLNEDVISHAGKGLSTEEGGKKPNLFIFNADCRYIFAVRVTGDFLHTSVVNLKGEMLAKCRTTALANATFEQTMRMIGDAFVEQTAERNMPRENCLAAAVGCDGVVDMDHGSIYQYPDWSKSLPVRESLRAVLPEGVPVHVDNWWRHLAYGEMHFNADRKRFFLLGNSGERVSGGMVLNRQISRGTSCFTGEVGHVIVEPHGGDKCVCGGSGCLESLVAPGKVLQRARDFKEKYPESMIFTGRGDDVDITFGHIAGAADEGDGLARFLLDEAAGHFAIALNNIVHICDPGEILFYGDYARAGNYFREKLQAQLGELILPGICQRTRINVSELGDEQGFAGAAIHMTDMLFSEGL